MIHPHPNFSVSNRTLITVRWVAIFGQIFGVMLAVFALGLMLPAREVSACIAILLGVNLFAMFFHGRRRLSENAAAAYLAFDIGQYALLLYFTGGFENPFAMLMIAQVAVAAAVLNLARMVILSFLSIFSATLLSIWNVPLEWPGGHVTITPSYLLGQQIALIFAVAFIASYVWRISHEFRDVQNALYDSQVSLSRQRQLAALGAQAAAAAHELGSPLSTITIIIKELFRDYAGDPELKDDLNILVEQTKRCSTILRDFATNPERDEDPLVTTQLLADVLRDLARSYAHERPDIPVTIIAAPARASVTLPHSTELYRSLGNLIQNAIQHAKSRVDVDITAYGERTRITIRDDGAGFAAQILHRIGEPYLTTKAKGAQNMGLGLFISQTLIEGQGGQVRFRNHPRGGAEVMITLPDMTQYKMEDMRNEQG